MYQEHLLLLAVGVFLLILTQFFAFRWNFYHIPSISEPIPQGFFKTMVGAFVLFFAIELLIFPGMALLWLYFTGQEMVGIKGQGWLNIGAILSLGFALAVYVSNCTQNVKKALFGTKKGFLFGVGALAVAYPPVLVIGQIMALVVLMFFQVPRLDQVAVEHLRLMAPYPILYWLTVIIFVTVVPLVEETLFRGFLQTALKDLFGVRGAIILTSFIFSVFHFSVSQGIDNIELLSSLFVLSCYLGFIYERERSLLAPIGLHFIFNVLGVILVRYAF